MRRLVAVTLVAALSLIHAAPAHAYLKFGFRLGDQTIDVRWPAGPIRYFISERDVTNVTAGDLRAAVTRAAATWQAVPGTTLSFEFQGFTTASPAGADSRNTIGFLDRPDLDRVLGATSLLLDGATGTIAEADIFFNTIFPWSVADAGETGRVDVESVVLHELGHFIGLGHSAIGETELTPSGGRRVQGSGAVMFPIALTAGSTADRALQPDDIAGLLDIYGSEATHGRTGSIQGRVEQNGRGVFGAHVTAFNLITGTIVGGFTLNTDGEFVIAGLAEGPHLVRVEPLDDADVESFLAGGVDVNFRVAYAPRLLVVPKGGAAAPITIPVVPK